MILDPAGLLDEVRVKNLRLSKSAEQMFPVVAALPLASVVPLFTSKVVRHSVAPVVRFVPALDIWIYSRGPGRGKLSW